MLIWLSVEVAEAQRLTERKVRRLLERSDIMQEHFVGFVLQEAGGRIVYEQHEDKYFVPASNTKLLTLYAAMGILGDSIPALKYEISGDSLIFWGTGDPSFLHPKLDNRKVYDFLAAAPYQLFLGDADPIDFEPSYWRSDPGVFPIYANSVQVNTDGINGLLFSPKAVQRFVRMDSSLSASKFDLLRSKISEELLYPNLPIPQDFKDFVPFPVTLEVSRVLLEDTLKKDVTLIRRKKTSFSNTLYSIPSDSLYKHMMLPSDNFLAEQLLLLCAGIISDTLDVKKTIDYSLKNQWEDWSKQPEWVDGSGLSRYNMFTPRTVLEVLNRLEKKISDPERLKLLLPAGGVSGTLKNAYKTDNEVPFVWAKTGTLRFTHLQSGWIETRKGKSYRFVFMNNNFVRPTAEVREEMVRIMTEIRQRY